jgi:hypothetical protein
MDISIEMLISKRDYDTATFTKKILGLFSENLTKAIQLFTKSDREVTWHRVERFPAVEGYILVAGEMEIREGDMLLTNRGEVLITPDNKAQYTNNIKYVLNSKILQNESVETIYKHIKFVDSLGKSSIGEAEIIQILRSGATTEAIVLENPALAPLVEKITRPTVFDSFATETLSEEQFNSFKLNSYISKSRVH